jgi:hypothetical protein
MSNSESQTRSALGIASGMLLLVNIGWLVHVVTHILAKRHRYAELYRNFEVEVPFATRLFAEVSDWGIIAAGIGVFLFLGIKELILPWRSIRFALNLAALVGLILLVELFYDAMTTPLLEVFELLGGP